MSRRPRILLAVLAAGALLVLCAGPFMGRPVISPSEAFAPGTGVEHGILTQIRIPRVLAAFLAGAALAASGMAFQALFRNPLATPFTLGVSSGASLGVAVYVWLGLSLSLPWLSGVTLFAFGGALAAILLVYGLTRLRRGASTATLLLAGVAVSFFCSSLILFIQYLSDYANSFRILHWLMGGLDVMGYDAVLSMLPLVTAGCAILWYLTHELNLLTTGEDLAASRGVEVKKTQRLLFFATSLMIGGVVAFCGPIGFVGMMAPHMCRLMIGSNHRHLLPATLLFGGVFLVACDTLARTVIFPAEIPVGVLTALLGGPFFLWLLFTSAFGVEGGRAG